jgi:DNA-binding response OmpR family regulator
VLLVGKQWDILKPALTALVRQGKIVLLEPVSQNGEEVVSRDVPSVIIVSPGYEYRNTIMFKVTDSKRLVCPSILMCVALEALEEDDLYTGVDDFLVIPCSAVELSKRIKRLAWKDQSPLSSSQLRVGKITLDLDTYQVMLGEKRVDLAWMEFQLLKFLMQNPGRVFTREQLLAHVWGVDGFGGTRTVDVHIRRLRSKLGGHGHEYFRTVKNVGYGMVNSP